MKKKKISHISKEILLETLHVGGSEIQRQNNHIMYI